MVKILCLLLGLLAVPIQGERECPMTNMSTVLYYGSQTILTDITSWEECGRRCKPPHTDDCTCWTWREKYGGFSGYCVLKDECRFKAKEEDQPISGDEDCPKDTKVYEYKCAENNWEGEQYCRCKPGEAISTFQSLHSTSSIEGKYEDRKWELECRPLPGILEYYSSSIELTEYKQSTHETHTILDYTHENKWLVGLESKFNSYRKDRDYTYFWASSENAVLVECTDWKELNPEMEKDVYYEVLAGRVIAGLDSEFIHGHKDRKFKIKTCKIMEKCDKIVNMKYFLENNSTVMKPAVAGNGQLNNLGAEGLSTWSLTVEKSKEQAWSTRTMHTKIEGWEVTAGMSMDTSASMSVGVVELGGGMTMSIGGAYSSETGLERETTDETTDITTTSTTAEHKCPEKRYCFGKIIVTQATVSIPYRIRMINSINPAIKCRELGMFTKVQSYGATAVFLDLNATTYAYRKRMNTLPLNNLA